MVAQNSMTHQNSGPLGVLAGNGRFPLELIRAVQASGREVVVVAHKGETESAIARLGGEVSWISLGQLQRALDIFKARGVREAVLLGGITKTAFFGRARPDARGLRLLARVAVRSDDHLLRAIAREFEDEGIRIVASTPWLSALATPSGVIGRHQPDDEGLADVAYGLELAVGLGEYDVGQTVVVKERVPIALEGIEGTDACIRRAGKLAGKGAVVVKMVKPGQDFRFDLPAAGSRTVKVCAAAGVKVLAMEAGGVIIADLLDMIRLADRLGIVLMGVERQRSDQAVREAVRIRGEGK